MQSLTEISVLLTQNPKVISQKFTHKHTRCVNIDQTDRVVTMLSPWSSHISAHSHKQTKEVCVGLFLNLCTRTNTTPEATTVINVQLYTHTQLKCVCVSCAHMRIYNL